jgi:hypothetical protein
MVVDRHRILEIINCGGAMLIVGIILNTDVSSECISPLAYNYSNFISDMSKYKHVSLALQLDTDSFLFLDAKKIFAEQPIEMENETVRVDSWDKLNDYIIKFDKELLQNYLTKTIVPRLIRVSDNKRIPCPFYSNIETQLRIIGGENTFGISAELADINDPYRPVSKGTGWGAPDVRIINTGRTDIDFNNTIPVINGNVFYPEVVLNQETGRYDLFALQAGKWVTHCNWNQSKVKTVKHNRIPSETNNPYVDKYAGGELPVMNVFNYNKGLMLIDFSSIGTISTYKLAACRDCKLSGNETTIKTPVSGNPKTNPDTAWFKPIETKNYNVTTYTFEFTLPKGAQPGIPIVCICGKLFFNKEHVRTVTNNDDIKITISIPHDEFDNILLSNLQWYGKQIPGTSLVEADPSTTLKEVFIDAVMGHGSVEDVNRYLNEDLNVPYVIMLHTNNKTMMTHTQPKMTLGPDKLLFPSDVGGLLINKKSHEIIDYVRIPYASGTLVEFSMQRPLLALHDEDQHTLTRPQLGFENIGYEQTNKYMQFNRVDNLRDISNFELIDFAYVGD